jgi:hypothetical protein
MVETHRYLDWKNWFEYLDWPICIRSLTYDFRLMCLLNLTHVKGHYFRGGLVLWIDWFVSLMVIHSWGVHMVCFITLIHPWGVQRTSIILIFSLSCVCALFIYVFTFFVSTRAQSYNKIKTWILGTNSVHRGLCRINTYPSFCLHLCKTFCNHLNI